MTLLAVRVGIPVIWTALAVALSQDPIVFGIGVAVALPLAIVRIAGERMWSLLPQATIATMLIAPEHVWLTATVVLTASAGAAAVRPRRIRAAATNLASSGAAMAVSALAPSWLTEALREGTVGTLDAAVLAAVGLAWFWVDTLLWLIHEPALRLTYRGAVSRLAADWRVAVVLVSSAYALAALWHHNWGWALLTASIPLLLASRLADQVRRHHVLVDLTVQALGRLPEAAGVAQRSHSKHVAELAVAMGRVCGTAGKDLDTLRRVALLHDVGLVETTRPAVDGAGFTSADVHRWGARLIAANEEFRREAAMMLAMADPYRMPGADPISDRRAQIVRVACRVVAMLEIDPVNRVVESMYADSIYTFDPAAIALVRPAMDLLGWPALPELT